MKSPLYIVILIAFVLVGEAIGNALLWHQHENLCLVDGELESEAEKECKEKEAKKKLQINLQNSSLVCFNSLAFNNYTHLNISQQVSRDVMTPPPRLS